MTRAVARWPASDEPDDDGASNVLHWLGLLATIAFAVVFFLAVLVAGMYAVIGDVFARDVGQWGDRPANIQKWFQSLMQPDEPTHSCCGEADAFEADAFEVEGDHYVAIITDGKGVLPNGKRVPVPNAKMKWDAGNPSGHGQIFIGSGGQVYCYVTPGGA